MDSNAIDWRALLDAGLERLGSKAALAGRLGFSRAYVSRVMNPEGKSGIPEPHDTFVQRVIERLSGVECPISHRPPARSECDKANDPAPIHNPIAVQLWRKCQTCPHKPNPQKGGSQ